MTNCWAQHIEGTKINKYAYNRDKGICASLGETYIIMSLVLSILFIMKHSNFENEVVCKYADIFNTNNGEKTMKKLFSAVFTVVVMFGFMVSPAYSATYEQAKTTQVKNALKTTDGIAITAAVNKYSALYKLDPILVHAVILTESGYSRTAKSPCGATGVMQLMPNTFYSKGFKDIYSIDENVHAGVKHLAGLHARYQGNVYLALAAYNAGGGYVSRYNGEVPPAIKPYVNKVLHHKTIVEKIIL